MKISGYIKNSFVDYPGQIACVLFVPGCNMDCYFCHNKHLLENGAKIIDNEEILKFLKERKGFLDAVVITGGEPTLQKDLEEFISLINEFGYPVKIDSNGFSPDVIERLIKTNSVAYFAIDIKAPLHKYKVISTTKNDIEALKRTISILLASDIEYEFRTTFLPELQAEDIYDIAGCIIGAKNYYLQQFKPLTDQNGLIDMRAIKKPHSKEYIMETHENVKKILIGTNVALRGVK